MAIGILITTIFKFKDIEIDDIALLAWTTGTISFVLVDRAHHYLGRGIRRKCAGRCPMPTSMAWLVLPISGIDRNTFKLFGAEDPGRYMSRYSYKRVDRDGATNPVKFDLSWLNFRKWIVMPSMKSSSNWLPKQHGWRRKSSIVGRAGKLAIMLQEIPRRMAAVSNDIAEHFTNHVMPKRWKAWLWYTIAWNLCADVLFARWKAWFDAVEVVMNVDRAQLKLKRWQKTKLNKDGLNGMMSWSCQSNKSILNAGSTLMPKNRCKGSDWMLESWTSVQLIIVTAKAAYGFDAPICYCMVPR